MQHIVSFSDAYTYVFFIAVYILNEIRCESTSTTACQKKAAVKGESVISMCSYSTVTTFKMTTKNIVLDVTSGLKEKVPGSCTCIVGLSDLANDLTVTISTSAYFKPGHKECGTSVSRYTDPRYIRRKDCNLDHWKTKLNNNRFITITYTQHQPPYDDNYCIKVVPLKVAKPHGLKVFCLPFTPGNQTIKEVPTTTTESMSSSNTTSGMIDCSDANVPVLVTVIIAILIIICSVVIHVLLFLRKKKVKTLTKSPAKTKNEAIQFVSSVPVEYESIRKSTLVPAVSNTYDDLKYDEVQTQDVTVETKTNGDAGSSVIAQGVSHEYALPKESLTYENYEVSCDQRQSSQCLVVPDDNYADGYVEPNNKNVVSRNDSSYLIPVS